MAKKKKNTKLAAASYDPVEYWGKSHYDYGYKNYKFIRKEDISIPEYQQALKKVDEHSNKNFPQMPAPIHGKTDFGKGGLQPKHVYKAAQIQPNSLRTKAQQNVIKMMEAKPETARQKVIESRTKTFKKSLEKNPFPSQIGRLIQRTRSKKSDLQVFMGEKIKEYGAKTKYGTTDWGKVYQKTKKDVEGMGLKSAKRKTKKKYA